MADTIEQKLLPCPFCGGEAEVERQGTARQSHIIACTDCGARLETGEVWNAGTAWNTRVPASAMRDMAEALERLTAKRHIHRASLFGSDDCAICGENFRDPVHYRSGESDETDREFARTALASYRAHREKGDG